MEPFAQRIRNNKSVTEIILKEHIKKSLLCLSYFYLTLNNFLKLLSKKSVCLQTNSCQNWSVSSVFAWLEEAVFPTMFWWKWTKDLYIYKWKGIGVPWSWLCNLIIKKKKNKIKKATARGLFSEVFLLSAQPNCSRNTENIARTW